MQARYLEQNGLWKGNTDMKRLLYIQDSFGTGGINVVESIKENWLHDNGYEVCNLNVLNNRTFDGSFRYREGIKKYYIERESLDKLYQVPCIGVFLRFLYYRIKLIYLILKINPDIIIASRDELEPFTVVLFTFWKKRILEFHCGFLDNGINNYPLKKRLRCKVKFRFYHIVALTKKDQELRATAYKQKVFVIPNPLKATPINYSTQENKKILILARFTSQKNLPNLLLSWENVQKKHPDWTLDIYGEGEDKDRMLKVIKERKLNTVHVNGYVNAPFKIIPEYSIFLLPSLYEGFPMVLIECMSCGVPAVAYNCLCGPDEVIKDGEDGIIVQLNDMDAFIEKVNNLIEHPELRKSMSLKCRENIKRYALDKVMAQWIDLFNKI